MTKGEHGIWQRRYWEHLIRDEEDYRKHVDYIHFISIETRIKALKAVLTTEEHQQAVDVVLGHSLAVWLEDNVPVVTHLASQT